MKETHPKACEQVEEAKKYKEMYRHVQLLKSNEERKRRSTGNHEARLLTGTRVPQQVPEISRGDLTVYGGETRKVGRGSFGSCYLMDYRGLPVVVNSIRNASVSK